jgi:hypothetical protein
MPGKGEECIIYIIGIQVLLLLSDEGFEGRDDDVVISQYKCFPLAGPVEPHPRQSVWEQMSCGVSEISIVPVFLTFSIAYSKLQELPKVSLDHILAIEAHLREYGTTTKVDLRRPIGPVSVKIIGSRALQAFNAINEIIVKDFPSPTARELGVSITSLTLLLGELEKWAVEFQIICRDCEKKLKVEQLTQRTLTLVSKKSSFGLRGWGFLRNLSDHIGVSVLLAKSRKNYFIFRGLTLCGLFHPLP